MKSVRVRSENETETESEINNNIRTEIDEEDICYFRFLVDDPKHIDNFEKHMVAYTASTIQRAIIEGKWYTRIKCEKCLRVFSEDEEHVDDLIELKMKTDNNLRPVSMSTFKICIATEKLMQKLEYQPKKYHSILTDISRILQSDELFYCSEFYTHDENNHKNSLINMIINMYIKKRQDYISRSETLAEHDVLLRSKLKNLIHFKGQ